MTIPIGLFLGFVLDTGIIGIVFCLLELFLINWNSISSADWCTSWRILCIVDDESSACIFVVYQFPLR